MTSIKKPFPISLIEIVHSLFLNYSLFSVSDKNKKYMVNPHAYNTHKTSIPHKINAW